MRSEVFEPLVDSRRLRVPPGPKALRELVGARVWSMGDVDFREELFSSAFRSIEVDDYVAPCVGLG